MRGGLGDSRDPRGRPAAEDGAVLGDRHRMRGLVELLEIDVLAAAIVIAELVELHREVGAELDQRQYLPL